jgi:hypothetical protein
MRFKVLPTVLFSLILASTTYPQSGPGDANSQRGGRGFGGFGMGMGVAGGRGVMGTVTEVAADHFIIKSEDGQTYTVHFSVNTRIMKQPAGSRIPGGMRGRGGQGAGAGFPQGGTPPETIKATDIKVGDAIGAMGEVDQSAKSIGAVAVVQLDPETARQMAEMRANYGKTWIQGKVTAIDGVKVTLLGLVDNVSRSFVADENTTFRKRREPITLADIEVGDTLRVDGELKAGVFTAANVSVMGMPPGGMPGGRPDAPPMQ